MHWEVCRPPSPYNRRQDCVSAEGEQEAAPPVVQVVEQTVLPQAAFLAVDQEEGTIPRLEDVDG